MIRKRNRRRLSMPSAEINLTPLIDMSLTLLVIFMITAPMINNAIRVTLPQGKAQEDGGAQQELIVHMDEKSKLYFNGKEVDEQQMIAAIQTACGTQEDKTVFVKADTVVPYGHVIRIVDQIKVVGGVRYVALSTQKVA